jgi:hypothetical protein
VASALPDRRPARKITVVDDYADDEGQLTVRLLGLPLQRQRGPETVWGAETGVPPANR